MAYKSKKDKAAEPDSNEESNKPTASLEDVFESIDKLNPNATLLSDESSLSVVNDWIDTGSYALNAIFSGSLYKGVPVGRITGLFGPTGCGKTLIINKIIANAQKKGYFAAVWDTESAVDQQSAEGVGVDTNRVKYYPVEAVEECRNQIATFLDKIIAANNPDIKVIIAIDSLGNLASSKELRDVVEGKDAVELGAKAKALRSMLRALTFKAAKARVPILFSNHIYDNPMAMYPELVKKQAGGMGPLYLASLLVQLAVKNEKIDKDSTEESVAVAHNVNGITLSAMTVKNRFVPPFLKAELYNNFRSGLSRYAGIKDMAQAFGIITSQPWALKGEPLGKIEKWEKDENFWEQRVLPLLEAALKEKVCYGSTNTVMENVEELVKE